LEWRLNSGKNMLTYSAAPRYKSSVCKNHAQGLDQSEGRKRSGEGEGRGMRVRDEGTGKSKSKSKSKKQIPRCVPRPPNFGGRKKNGGLRSG